jgi:hypothetical protein
LPTYFHNIGQPEPGRTLQSLWDSLRKKGIITAGFGNRPGDRGERVLKRYQKGDVIFAYANGFGVVGYGIAKGQETYRLVAAAKHGSNHRHEAGIAWQLVVAELIHAVPSSAFRPLTFHQPRQTSERLSGLGAERLMFELTCRWGDVAFAEEVPPAERYPEGAVISKFVNAYERNRAARDACVAHYGAKCVVCGFDFGREYGPEGQGLIHVHHLVPLSQIHDDYEVSPIEDLRPVCPNCHLMIHVRTPIPFAIDELKEMRRQASGS